MASVELRPGDTLNIIWVSAQDTPLGRSEVESIFAFSYDDLLQRLQTQARVSKSRRSANSGARFSRMVALSTTALRKGTWSTGATIDKSEVFDRLVQRFRLLQTEDYSDITAHARDSILELYDEGHFLLPRQRAALQTMVAAVQSPTSV